MEKCIVEGLGGSLEAWKLGIEVAGTKYCMRRTREGDLAVLTSTRGRQSIGREMMILGFLLVLYYCVTLLSFVLQYCALTKDEVLVGHSRGPHVYT